MKDLLVYKALKYTSTFYVDSDRGGPYIIISFIASAALMIICGIAAGNPESDKLVLRGAQLLMNLFGGGFWVGLVLSSFASFITVFIFSALALKFCVYDADVMSEREVRDCRSGFVTHIQFSLFYFFGAGFLFPIYMLSVISASLVLTPIIVLSPVKTERLLHVANKILPNPNTVKDSGE